MLITMEWNFSMEKTRRSGPDGSAIFGMTALELGVSLWVAGDPADVGNADDVAVLVGLENVGAASFLASSDELKNDVRERTKLA
jgi:predicted peroxiredoxin